MWECLLKSTCFREQPEKTIDMISDWIRGQTSFLELFDAGAISASSPGRRTDSYSDIACNGDIGSFVAERTSQYKATEETGIF